MDTIRDPLPGDGDGNAPAPQVPGIIGTELAPHAKVLEAVMLEIGRGRQLTRSQFRTFRTAVRAVQRIALLSRQVSRLAGGRLRQAHEEVALHESLKQVVDASQREFATRGVQVQLQLAPVQVIVDPGLLRHLADLALRYMAAKGHAVHVFLQMRNWPEHGLLTLRARELVRTAPDERQPQEPLDWIVLVQLARAMGLVLQREFSDGELTVTLEFPRTVRRHEGLTAIEIDGDHGPLSELRPLAGCRVLLVSADRSLRDEIQVVCHDMGLVVDISPTVGQAVRYCELDKPDGIVVDERLHDAQFDQLRADLLRYDVNFPCIEIAVSSNVVEISGLTGDSISRISRDAVRSQLASLLVMELARVL